VGGLDKNYKEKDTRTPEQKETLKWLIGELKHRLNISKVQGHRDYSPDTNNNGVIEEFEWIKSCPCFDAIPEYKDI
jgi:N-acetylmuramoyl-L-alanine amidase